MRSDSAFPRFLNVVLPMLLGVSLPPAPLTLAQRPDAPAPIAAAPDAPAPIAAAPVAAIRSGGFAPPSVANHLPAGRMPGAIEITGPTSTGHAIMEVPGMMTPRPCRRCVNRSGDSVLDALGKELGIGPCDECECWQCPHDAPFNYLGPGEYAGPARTRRVPEYRLRTGDVVQLTFLITALRSEGAYRLAVGDELLIESEADETIARGDLQKGLEIQPDGTITLRLIGQIYAAGQTVDQLRDLLNGKYAKFYPEPAIDVTPVRTGTAARLVREAISGVGGFDPQQVVQTITPAGEIRLPKLGAVPAQGLTLDELKMEINLRYDREVGGLEVEPALQSQAPHQFFVLGEVRQPGRFEFNNNPTTVIGALAVAGSYLPGANLRQIVVFRRGDNWELLSTVLDLRGALLGRSSDPVDEIWLRDGDVIIVPSSPIRLFDNFVRQVFTEGIYGVFPVSANYNFGDLGGDPFN